MSYEGEPDFSHNDNTASIPTTSPKRPSKVMTPSKLRCPVCDGPFDQATTTAMPFCSLRCKQIDLGRWLNESYGMPYESEDLIEGFGQPEDEEDD